MIQDTAGMRAVYYARVSTEEEKQINALSKQVEECEECIKAQGWRLAGRYVDEGKSGTKVKGRDEYKRLFEDLEKDTFDIIVIKSQDRLMRNVKDWYIFLDRMLTHKKQLFMYIENSFYTSDNALITGIKAILAEEYSRELSKKLKNAHKRRVERAKKGEKVAVMSPSITLGYDLKDGEVVINEKEAEIVRYVFTRYLQGAGFRKIAMELEDRGWMNRAGNHYEPASIQRIITNERYMGVYVMNRKVNDFDKKKSCINPESEWVRIEGIIPPIISTEVWEKANEIRLSKVRGGKGVKRGKSIFSGKIICGKCKGKYHRLADIHGTRFRCSTYARYGKTEKGCDGRSFYERDLWKALQELSEAFLSPNYDEIEKSLKEWLKGLYEALRSSQGVSDVLEEIARQESRKEKLTEAYMDGIISKVDYARKYSEIEEKIEQLREKERDAETEEEIADVKAVIDNFDTEFKAFLKGEDFKQKKAEYLAEHIKTIVVTEEGYGIELDLMGGVMLTGKDFYLFVHEDRVRIYVRMDAFMRDGFL